jgi:hypothetical protein
MLPSDFLNGKILCQGCRNNNYGNRPYAGRPPKLLTAEDEYIQDLKVMSRSQYADDFYDNERPAVIGGIVVGESDTFEADERLRKKNEAKAEPTFEGLTYTHRLCEERTCNKSFPLKEFNVYRKKDNEYLYHSPYCSSCRAAKRKAHNDKTNLKVMSAKYREEMIRWARVQMASVRCYLCDSAHMEGKGYYNSLTMISIPMYQKPFKRKHSVVAHEECVKKYRFEFKIKKAVFRENIQITTDDDEDKNTRGDYGLFEKQNPS